HRKSIGIAPGVGPPHHLVTLIVVPEDEEPITECGLGHADHRLEFLRRCVPIAVGKRDLEPQHVGIPPEGDIAGVPWDSLGASPRDDIGMEPDSRPAEESVGPSGCSNGASRQIIPWTLAHAAPRTCFDGPRDAARDAARDAPRDPPRGVAMETDP